MDGYRTARWAFFAAMTLVWMSCDDGKENGEEGGGEVVVPSCDATQDMCLSDTEVLHCVDDVRKREYCGAGEKCFEGRCGAVVCTPGAIESCLSDGRFHGCNGAGTGMGDFDCGYGLTCLEGECRARLCMEGSGKCLDENTILLCNEAGTAYSLERPCQEVQEKTVCEEGRCIPICEKATKDASYIGCEYWAVDLDNAIDAGVYDAAGQPFAVVLSNTHDSLAAHVVIRQKEKGKIVKVLEFDLAPHVVQSAYLPNKCYDGGLVCEDAYRINGTVISDAAYYIESDLPITAAQFNPLNNENVYSNDASLLFPTTALGMRYMVMGRPQHYDSFHGFVTVVATQPGQTQVRVKAACRFMAGRDKSGGDVYSMQKGDSQVFYLDQYDVLNLETAAMGEDPTGTTLTSDKRIAVFAGNEATSIPETDPVTCCADHIEHQQYPVGAWGRKYHAVKLKPRGKERDMWRILARTDNTRIVATPNVFAGEALTLNAGQYYDILTTESFELEASAPVLLGQFMTGQNDPHAIETGTYNPDSANIGDPAYLIGVPIEQYRSEYRFLVPSKYAEDYITIVAPAGVTVKLDGSVLSTDRFSSFGKGDYKAAYVRIEDGAHSISADGRIGLFSYGFDNYVSYGYPAGLDLKELFE